MGGFNVFGNNFDPVGNIGNAIYFPGSPNNPKPQLHLPQMDSGSANQIANQENSLEQSPDQNTQKILQGTGSAANIQNNGAAAAIQNQELGGGGMPGMSTAIANKAQKNFSVQQGRLQQNAKLQGQQMTNQNMLTASAQGVALMDAQAGVQSSINNLQLSANQATYQTVSSIMSGAGSLGGMALANSQRAGGYDASNTQGFAGSTPSVYNDYSSPTSDVGGTPSVYNDYGGGGGGMGNYGQSGPGLIGGGGSGG